MTALLIGLLAATSAVLLLAGLRSVRSDALDTLAADDLRLLRPEQRRRASGDTALGKAARRLVPTLRRALGAARLASLERRINEAGRPDGLTLDGFLERISMWLVLMAPLVVLFATQRNVLAMLLSAALPVLLPFGVLSSAHRRRRAAMDRDLPDFLDVLAVTVMAGVNFRQALSRVAVRFPGALADEVQLTLHQIANGASVRDAFTDLRNRSSSEPVGQFVSALLQSQELGAPLAESLQQIAEDMRRDSGQRQRQKAARTSPQVTLVTSLVLVPGALIFIVVGMWLGADIDFSSILGVVE